MFIKRHAQKRIDFSNEAEHVREILEIGHEYMSHRAAANLASGVSDWVRLAGTLCLLEPESPEVCSALSMAAQYCVSVFRLASVEKGTPLSVATGYGQEVLTVVGTGPTSHTHPGTWLMGFYTATISRRPDLSAQLADIPIELLRASSTRDEECGYLHVEALQTFWKNDSSMGGKLVAAVEATDPSRIKLSDGAYSLLVTAMELELLYRLVEADEVKFNETLHRTLEHHKKYWQKNRYNNYNYNNPKGFVALGALALASIAHMRGMNIAVESDYLPPALYKGIHAV